MNNNNNASRTRRCGVGPSILLYNEKKIETTFFFLSRGGRSYSHIARGVVSYVLETTGIEDGTEPVVVVVVVMEDGEYGL
ncbi:hypothetical protein L1887_15287 [Cichorium endivia]|nr:hypothetical protein L1887_15287 [Cichorium endivia]